jgi:hypothetical protein
MRLLLVTYALLWFLADDPKLSTDAKDELPLAANLGLEPDLNEGGVRNIAPLRELVP